MGLVIEKIAKYKTELICPHRFEYIVSIDHSGWNLCIDIRMNLKDEVKITFEIHPPIWMPRKEAEKLTFKTTSYRKVKQWIKKHREELTDPIEL